MSSRGNFYDDLTKALRNCGWEIHRRNHGHDILKRGEQILTTNFGIQEYMRHSPETDRVFPHSYRFADGYLHPGEEPGLGVDIDEDLAAQYPYRRAYLPINRLVDGTVSLVSLGLRIPQRRWTTSRWGRR